MGQVVGITRHVTGTSVALLEGMDGFDDLPTQVMVRIPLAPRARLASFTDVPTKLVTLPPELMARIRGIAPRKRVPKALFALVASAALVAIPSVRATCAAGAHHVARSVGSHVMFAR